MSVRVGLPRIVAVLLIALSILLGGCAETKSTTEGTQTQPATAANPTTYFYPTAKPSSSYSSAPTQPIPTTKASSTPPTSIPIKSSTPPSAPSALPAAQVVRVIDGDTIEVALGGELYSVRYIGIDTPETVHPTIGEEPYGREASNKNKELVEGKVVRLEKDISETDQYDRLLRYVYVGDLFVNAELVRLGYAQVSTYPPDVKYQGYFLQLQREAREAGRGLWGITTSPSSTPKSAPAPTSTQLSISLPTQQALSLQIIEVTSPVSRFSNATLVAKTLPGAQCEIAVYYKSGPSSASGLSPKSADGSGRVLWTWRVGSNTTPGNWQIVVKAIYAGDTVTQSTYFTVR